MFSLKKLNINNINPDDIPEDKILEAFDKLKEYCSENKINLKDFINNDENITKASEIIHGKLNMAQRAILSKSKIEGLLQTHIGFIRTKVDELSNKEKDTEKTNNAINDLDDLF